jgi:hypothetical protein
MITLNNIDKLLQDAQAGSARQGKHSITLNNGNIEIASPKFKEGVSIPLVKAKAVIKTVEQSRLLIRHMVKLQGNKYNSSCQNIADKLFDIVKAYDASIQQAS